MNRTNQLGSFFAQSPADREEARTVLTKNYPGITYDEATDQYLYRGYRFDYFKAAVSMIGGPNDYLLVDPENPQWNWLFIYGDAEQRWKAYVERRKDHRSTHRESRSWLGRVWKAILS